MLLPSILLIQLLYFFVCAVCSPPHPQTAPAFPMMMCAVHTAGEPHCLDKREERTLSVIERNEPSRKGPDRSSSSRSCRFFSIFPIHRGRAVRLRLPRLPSKPCHAICLTGPSFVPISHLLYLPPPSTTDRASFSSVFFLLRGGQSL